MSTCDCAEREGKYLKSYEEACSVLPSSLMWLLLSGLIWTQCVQKHWHSHLPNGILLPFCCGSASLVALQWQTEQVIQSFTLLLIFTKWFIQERVLQYSQTLDSALQTYKHLKGAE